MNVYTLSDIGESIKDNSYVGRGIVIGKSADGKKAVFAYFIMGRSENSRNRIFREEGDDVTIYPYDESKVKDPSLITSATICSRAAPSRRRWIRAALSRTRPTSPPASAASCNLTAAILHIK